MKPLVGVLSIAGLYISVAGIHLIQKSCHSYNKENPDYSGSRVASLETGNAEDTKSEDIENLQPKRFTIPLDSDLEMDLINLHIRHNILEEKHCQTPIEEHYQTIVHDFGSVFLETIDALKEEIRRGLEDRAYISPFFYESKRTPDHGIHFYGNIYEYNKGIQAHHSADIEGGRSSLNIQVTDTNVYDDEIAVYMTFSRGCMKDRETTNIEYERFMIENPENDPAFPSLAKKVKERYTFPEVYLLSSSLQMQ